MYFFGKKTKKNEFRTEKKSPGDFFIFLAKGSYCPKFLPSFWKHIINLTSKTQSSKTVL